MYVYCKIMMSKMFNWVSKIEMINVSISGEKVNAPFWHPQQRKHTRPYWAKWIPSPAGMLKQLFLAPKYAAKYICMQKLLSIPMKEIHVSTRIHDIKCCLKDMILERGLFDNHPHLYRNNILLGIANWSRNFNLLV